jgi:hypothetical protein
LKISKTGGEKLVLLHRVIMAGQLIELSLDGRANDDI